MSRTHASYAPSLLSAGKRSINSNQPLIPASPQQETAGERGGGWCVTPTEFWQSSHAVGLAVGMDFDS